MLSKLRESVKQQSLNFFFFLVIWLILYIQVWKLVYFWGVIFLPKLLGCSAYAVDIRRC